jgi:hypothetical protein|tara:strand:+ start:89 stop:346 length:258 start_codon:yes stop_codon:yes gene_type:complete
MVEQFCKSILQIEIENKKALANIVMGLSSQPNIKSVVEISLSPCYHYQYSSISKVISSLYEKDKMQKKGSREEKSRGEVEKKFVN